jgi:DNA repair protein RecO (recombination protein O)
VAEGRQIPHHGEAIVLRTWPFHEADLLVSLLTREGGKVKGVARHAMRSRKRFGGALEPGTYVRAHYTERPRQELVRLDSFEVLWSPLAAPVDASRLAGMQLVVEVLEEAMPEGAADDNVFRLAMACLTAMQGTGKRGQGIGMRNGTSVWAAVTYFCVWMSRLMGWWPEMGHCAACGLDLRGADVWWSPVADGVTCGDDRRPQSQMLRVSDVAEAQAMARMGLETLLGQDRDEVRGRELREFAVGLLERHLERRIRSAAFLRE